MNKFGGERFSGVLFAHLGDDFEARVEGSFDCLFPAGPVYLDGSIKARTPPISIIEQALALFTQIGAKLGPNQDGVNVSGHRDDLSDNFC